MMNESENKSALQVIAIPSNTTTKEGVDHTFVYCPTYKKTFECWSDNNHADGDYVKNYGKTVATNEDSPSPYAYEIANAYRTPIQFGDTLHKDTAGIGIYGINGVCHQSANCFFLASQSVGYWEALWGKDHHMKIDKRPVGYWASQFVYGPYGNMFLLWWNKTYKPATKIHLKGQGVTTSKLNELESLCTQAIQKKWTMNEVIIQQVSMLTNQYKPDIEISKFMGTLLRLLKEKDKLIEADWNKSPVIGEELAKRLNELAVTIQKELENCIGPDNYEKLTGANPGEYFRIIDLRIASGKV